MIDTFQFQFQIDIRQLYGSIAGDLYGIFIEQYGFDGGINFY